MVTDPVRKTTRQAITTVRHVCRPFGHTNVNPPSLGQIREFVAACEGLPDSTAVSVQRGSLTEGGRYDYVFSVQIVESLDDGTVS